MLPKSHTRLKTSQDTRLAICLYRRRSMMVPLRGKSAMKHLTSASVLTMALAALSGAPAGAADIYPPVETYDWSGFYFGMHIGAGWGDKDGGRSASATGGVGGGDGTTSLDLVGSGGGGGGGGDGGSVTVNIGHDDGTDLLGGVQAGY